MGNSVGEPRCAAIFLAGCLWQYIAEQALVLASKIRAAP
jgi:hypothetical protein